MPVQHIHTYLVHPKKGSREPGHINGAAVRLNGQPFQLLTGIYEKSDQECDIHITFRPTQQGVQQNDCRDLICAYLGNPSLPAGRAIASRLEQRTDHRSGLGLLFLIAGREGHDHKVVISRFPTDNAIYVEEDPEQFAMEFLERVFMKNKASYKAVLYRDRSVQNGFWSGRAVDRQINNPTAEISNYWIQDFLASGTTVTPAAGTRRLALALKSAIKKADLAVKQELAAAATLANGLAGQRLSITEFGNRFGLSQEARNALVGELKSAGLANENFQFDLGEFRSLVAYKSIELDNGATLTAPTSDFDNVFHQDRAPDAGDQVRFTTQGRVTNERLKPQA